MAEYAKPTRATPNQATSAVAHVAPPPAEDDPLLQFAPYLHRRPRRNSITPELQRRFVATLAATGIVKQAAKSIGKSLEALYKLRKMPGAEGFDAAWDAALDRGVQRLEDCALERALQGTATPIVSGGEILGWWEKPDNHLLRFLLQHRLPQKYGGGTVGEAEREALREEIRGEMADAAWIDSEDTTDDLFAVLMVMFENKLAGRALVHGIDRTRPLREIAKELPTRQPGEHLRLCPRKIGLGDRAYVDRWAGSDLEGGREIEAEKGLGDLPRLGPDGED